MPHLGLAAYALAWASGLAAFGVFLYLYRTSRSPLVRSFLLFLGVQVLLVSATAVGMYVAAVGGAPRGAARPYYFVETVACGLFAYTAPRFLLEFADLPFAGAAKRSAIGSMAAVLVASPLALAAGGPPYLMYVAPTLGLVLFLSMMLYGQVRLILAYPRIRDRLGRIGVPALVAYNAACVAAGFLDSGPTAAQLAAGAWPYGTLLRPAFYVASNLVAIAWAFRYEASGTLARAASVEPDPARARGFGLTERELELSRRLAAGEANKEIAAALGLSPNTVRNHVHNIFEKTGARNRVELLRALCGADEARVD